VRRLSPDLAEDPLARCLVLDSRSPAAVTRRQCGQALDVEAGDQMRDGVTGASSCGAGGLLGVVAGGDGHEHGSPGNLNRGSSLRAAEQGQCPVLGVGERPEWILTCGATWWPPFRGSRDHRS
jgi:hypothetical protein